jgi:methylated-DNA-protein-cysteine methyltransferase-like protein
MSPSDAHSRFIAMLQAVPRGRVATYGQIARLAGFPAHARQVVWALHSSSKKHKLPWHRVINSQGRIGLPGERARARQKALLSREGVEVDAYGKVDLARFGWKPSQAAVKRVLRVVA